MAGPQAELTMEEALDLAPVAHARMIGSQRFVFVYQALGMVLGMLAGAIVGVAISLPLRAYLTQPHRSGAARQFG